MDQISKIKVLDVLSICRVRHEASANCKCSDCRFNGKDCVEAHTYAEVAVKCMKVKEVTNENKGNSKTNN